MMPIAQRLHRRLDDEIGRAEIRLANAEIDDVTALRDQRVGAGEDREGVFLANSIEGRDCTKHDCTPPARVLFAAWPRRHVVCKERTSADQAEKIKR